MGQKLGAMLKQLISSVLKKPATELYPFVKSVPIRNFRGKIKFLPEKCIGCQICMKDCPSKAITINKIGEKQYECVVDLSKCIYCAQCVDSCPKKALEATDNFELAQLDRNKLKETHHADNTRNTPTQA